MSTTELNQVALVRSVLITANPDGSIPLNAKIIADVKATSHGADAMAEVVRRANAYPELIKYVKGVGGPAGATLLAKLGEIDADQETQGESIARMYGSKAKVQP